MEHTYCSQTKFCTFCARASLSGCINFILSPTQRRGIAARRYVRHVIHHSRYHTYTVPITMLDRTCSLPFPFRSVADIFEGLPRPDRFFVYKITRLQGRSREEGSAGPFNNSLKSVIDANLARPIKAHTGSRESLARNDLISRVAVAARRRAEGRGLIEIRKSALLIIPLYQAENQGEPRNARFN